MRSIGEFFAKIQKVQTAKLFAYKAAADSIKKAAGIEIKISSIAFKGRHLVLKGLSSGEKSHIFMKKSAILKEIEGQKLSRIVEDIRF